MRPTLIVMVKEPRPGRVKTRLAADMGRIPATWWYRHQIRRVLRRLQDPRWRLVLAVTPDHAGLTSCFWPHGISRVPQGPGDLGARMHRLLAGISGPTCLIGSDIPGISPRHVSRAFAALRAADVVFGPATDGGFWLVGASRIRRDFFRGVRWSTEHALRDSVASAGTARIAYVDVLQDIDTLHDLTMTRLQQRASSAA